MTTVWAKDRSAIAEGIVTVAENMPEVLMVVVGGVTVTR
jgi:hypothetical protein